MEQTFIVEFGVILAVATVLGIIARLFRQPLVLAYLVAGVLIGPVALGLIDNPHIIETFAEIGIVFLLFLVGLELNPKRLTEIGNTALIAGFMQIIISGVFYYIIGQMFGYSSSTAIYMAIAFTFSSTAIIVTLLSNRKDLDSVHGKIIIGILLVQDFVALFLLTIMSAMHSSQIDLPIFQFVYQTIFRAGILFLSIYLVNRFLLPRVFNRIARSHELLFISSLAWCFALAVASLSLGFSAEIGAFLAGITIATLPFSKHIASKTKPLRDFFIMIFFVYMGSNLVFDDAVKVLPQAIALALAILIINPIVVSIAVSLMGFRKRTSFLSGITLTQTSEFSFIVIVLGTKLSILPKETITLASLVAIFSIFISTYLIENGSKVYAKLRGKLFFLRPNSSGHDLENLPADGLRNHTILIGYHRIGGIVLETLKEIGQEVAVIDYDPNQIKPLIEQKEYCIYGDAIDQDIIENLHVKNAKAVISTIDKFEESLAVIEEYRKANRNIEIIVTASDSDEALDLYKAGANLVIVPALISGDYLSFLLKKIGKGDVTMNEIRKKEVKAIEEHKTEPMIRSILKK